MDFGITILSLFITAFVYLIFPIIYKIKNGVVEKKTATKIALWNSIICAIIFVIINGLAGSASSFAPAVLYFWVARAIMTR